MEKPVQEQILDLLDRLAHLQAGFGQELRIHDALDRRQHTGDDSDPVESELDS